MNPNQHLSIQLFERAADQQPGKGLATLTNATKDELLCSNQEGDLLGVFATPGSSRMSGKTAAAITQLYNANKRRLGFPGEQRATGRPRIMRDRDVHIASYEPRLEGLTVDGARVVIGLVTCDQRQLEFPGKNG